MAKVNMNLGQILMTAGISNMIEQSEQFAKFCAKILKRYARCDWGDTCMEDKVANYYAVTNGGERVVAKYNSTEEPVFIITEWDRSYTTIMFASEY